MKLRSVDIAWAAGIIEGEAWIGTCWYKDKSWGSKGCISVCMTDKDVLKRLHKIFPVGSFRERRVQKVGWKRQYLWRVYRQADVAFILKTVLPWLGKRRSLAAKGVLKLIASKDKNWRNKPRRKRNV